MSVPGPPRKFTAELTHYMGEQISGHVIEQVRHRFESWNDPRAKLDRKYRRTSSALTFWLCVLSILTMVGVLSVVGGLMPGFVGATALAGAAGAGALAIGSAAKKRRIDTARQALPVRQPAPKPAALPGRASAARQPMRRLAEAQKTLHELLAQLESTHLVSVPLESIADARATGADAATAIYAASAQLQAVERARDMAPPLEQSELSAAVVRLQARLEESVDGYCALVAAAGRVVAESTVASNIVLSDATDHLAGLAAGLREINQ